MKILSGTEFCSDLDIQRYQERRAGGVFSRMSDCWMELEDQRIHYTHLLSGVSSSINMHDYPRYIQTDDTYWQR
jgi:hypothetical protein